MILDHLIEKKGNDFIDLYERFPAYKKLVKENKILVDKYDRTRTSSLNQVTKDSDEDFDSLLKKYHKMKEFRLKVYEEKFNYAGFGFLFVKKIDELIEKNPILVSGIRLNHDELLFKIIVNGHYLILECIKGVIKIKKDTRVLYSFNMVSLDERIYYAIADVIPEINRYDQLFSERFINKVEQFFFSKVTINNASVLTCIQVRAYDLDQYEKEIRLGIENGLNLVFDFSYFLDSYKTFYNKISQLDKEKLKNDWIKLFNSIHWNTDNFIQLKKFFDESTVYEELIYGQVNIATNNHYNMIFLMLLIRSYSMDKNHSVTNIFAKFLLYYYVKKGIVVARDEFFKVNTNDYLEIFDDILGWYQKNSFFPNQEVVLFFTTTNREDIEQEYELFKSTNGLQDLTVTKRINKLDWDLDLERL